MDIVDVLRATSQARETLKAADKASTDMARLLVGRLRHVNSNYALQELKRELRDFNIHTGRWKDR